MSRQVTILGAGLVGSLLSVLFRKRGYEVTIYERRPDMRTAAISAGRSINLATSARGWKALEIAGLKDELEPLAIPMYGRFLHLLDGSTAFQPYGRNNEAIYSVSRGDLNKKLMTLAEQYGAKIHFEHRCTHVDVDANCLHIESAGVAKTVVADLLFGADGAFSALRDSYTYLNRVNSDRQYLNYGYKELCILPGENGAFLMEKNALHIWPRGKFMLIALPNTDGTFTCTLFLPFEGEVSFDGLKTVADAEAFFGKYFPDAKALMPGFIEDFFNNPTASLATSHISKWHHRNVSALIGDAAHGIVPFYGQGMNAGFEDCTVLDALMEQYDDDWTTILNTYEQKRRTNGDAVAQLALDNFIEMRDKVADPLFLERKKIEKELGKNYPDKFISVYEMVSFSHIPYDTAIKCTQAQERLLRKIMSAGNYFEQSGNAAFVENLSGWVNDYHVEVQQLDFSDANG